MNKNEFAERICKTTQDELGMDYIVVLDNIYKNGGIGMKELVIKAKNQDLCPVIRLDFFYIAYASGMLTFSSIIEKILEIYKEKSTVASVDFEFFREFGNVKDRIIYRLMNKKMNQEILSEIPHKQYLDMIVGLYYSYEGEMGSGGILLFNSHKEMWGTSEEELFSLAEYNTKRLFPAKCITAEEVLADMGITEPLKESSDFKILSNPSKLYGATCMLYSGVVKELAQGKNQFILPSSLHEIIMVSDTFDSPDRLRMVTREINETQLSPLEVLSDNVYLYNATEDTIVVCE